MFGRLISKEERGNPWATDVYLPPEIWDALSDEADESSSKIQNPEDPKGTIGLEFSIGKPVIAWACEDLDSTIGYLQNSKAKITLDFSKLFPEIDSHLDETGDTK